MQSDTKYIERIAALEVQVKTLERTVNSMDEKIDSLLALKYKGTGAFILASSLFGTSIIGTLLMVIDWFKS